jgi:hypothetical protein
MCFSSGKNILNILSCVLNDAGQDCLPGPENRLKIFGLESNAAKLLLMTLLTVLLVIYMLPPWHERQSKGNFFGLFTLCTIFSTVSTIHLPRNPGQLCDYGIGCQTL